MGASSWFPNTASNLLSAMQKSLGQTPGPGTPAVTPQPAPTQAPSSYTSGGSSYTAPTPAPGKQASAPKAVSSYVSGGAPTPSVGPANKVVDIEPNTGVMSGVAGLFGIGANAGQPTTGVKDAATGQVDPLIHGKVFSDRSYLGPEANPATPVPSAIGGLPGLLGTALSGASHVPLVGPTLRLVGRVWTDAISHPVSDAALMLDKAKYDMINGKNPARDVFNESAWVKSWQVSNKVSPGQAVQIGWNNEPSIAHFAGNKVVDPLDLTAVQAHFDKSNVGSNMQSGIVDFFGGLLASKGASAVGKVPALLRDAPVGDAANIDKILASKGAQRFQSQIEDARARGAGASELHNLAPIKAMGPQGAPSFAAAVATVKPDQVGTLLRIALGDTKAVDALAAQGSEAAANRVAQMLEPAQIAEKLAFQDIPPVGDPWMAAVAKKQAEVANIALADTPAQAQQWLEYRGLMTSRTRGAAFGGQVAQLQTKLQFSQRAGIKVALDDMRTVPDQIAPIHRASWFDVPARIYQALTDKPAMNLINYQDGTAAESIRSLMNKSAILTPEFKKAIYDKLAGAKPGDIPAIHRELEDHLIPQAWADHYGIPVDTVKDVVATSVSLSQQAAAGLLKKAHGVIRLADGSDAAALHTGDEIVANPVMETQLQAGAQPMINLRHMEAIFQRLHDTGKLKTVMSMSDDAIKHVLQTVYGMWKPLVLLTMHRAYNHIGDDYLRSVAKLGGLTMMGIAGQGIKNFAQNRFEKLTTSRYIGNLQGVVEKAHNDANATLLGLKAQKAEQARRMAAGEVFPQEHQISDAVIQDAQARVDSARKDLESFVSSKDSIIRPPHRVGDGESYIKGTNVKAVDVFGGPNADYLRRSTSSHTFFQSFGLDSADKDYAKMLADTHATGQHIAIYPLMDNIPAAKSIPAHAAAYTNYINNHLRQSPLAKVFLNPQATLKDGMDFLKTGAGKAHLDALGLSPANAEGLANDVFKIVHTVLPDAVMRGRALYRPVTKKDLNNWFPNAAQRPPVAGEESLLSLGGHPAQSRLKQITQFMMKWTGSVPDDILVRHPVTNELFKVHRDNLFKSAAAQRGISLDKLLLMPDEVQQLTHTAFAMARRDMVGMVYDVSRFNDAGSMLRFVSPFFNPWYNALSSWGKLFKDNPALLLDVQRAKHGIWNNPYMVDSSTGQRANDDTPLGQLSFMGHSNMLGKATGGIMTGVPVKATTLLSPTYADSIGNPGFGPLVQIPANHLAKNEPGFALSDIFDKISGGRITKDDFQSVIPTPVTDILTGAGITGLTGTAADTNGTLATLTWKIYQGQYYEYLNGQRSNPPNLSDIRKQAAVQTGISMFGKIFSPLGYTPDSKYTHFVDEWHRLLTANNGDFNTAMQQYTDLYGENAMIFTQSLDKNVGGVAATAGALQSYKAHAADIKASPDLAAVVIGPEGNGNYASQALQWEYANGLRKTMTPEDAAKQANVNRGYDEYNKILAYEQATLHERGLKSINQVGAEDLKKSHNDWVSQQGDPNSKYYNPDFYAAHTSFNKDAYVIKVQGLEKIANDPNLLHNPLRSDIQSLNKYFQLRDMLQANLKDRPTQSLTASSNADWAAWWDYSIGVLKADDTKFGPLYERYLKHDVLTTPTLPLTNKVPITDIPTQ